LAAKPLFRTAGKSTAGIGGGRRRLAQDRPRAVSGQAPESPLQKKLPQKRSKKAEF